MTKQSWPQLGREIAKQLETETDPDRIAKIGKDAITKIKQHDKPENALKSVNREVLKVYPRKDKATPNYYFDEGGKGDLGRYRHLIFKNLTLGNAPKKTEATTPPEPETAKATNTTKTAKPKQTKTTKTQEIKPKMTIQITLDNDAQTALEAVLKNDSSRNIEEIASKAIAAYCKSIANKSTENIESISTEALLTEDKYKTLPGRGEELAKRAIQAIQIYNENAYGDVRPWAITQNAIATLTGAKQSAVKKALKGFNYEDYNQGKGIDGYTNRAIEGSIKDHIKLAELVPDGLPD